MRVAEISPQRCLLQESSGFILSREFTFGAASVFDSVRLL